ncbi:peptide chain release factor N(5)-glutamine methyltransferase [bacterium]|nr:MAG: peptide chain release factor N(5)-glutamine methyltransferase [bacterium]
MSKVAAPQEWTVLTMLEWATDFFTEKKVPVPRLSIEWIIAHALGIKRLDLYLQFDRPLTPPDLDAIRPLIKRRAVHEPLQYIIGETDFYTSTFKVNNHVLIPRPETEELVELILSEHPSSEPLRVLDIGTGSGCIAISLKKERPNWEVVGVDISPDALAVAKENAALNTVDVQFELGNLFAERILNGTPFDLIVSNPPYIAPSEAELMERQVKFYEPKLALFAEDPLSVYKGIERISRAQLDLSKSGKLYLELNENLAVQIGACYSENYWQVELKKDLSGKPRMLINKLMRK